MAAYGNANRIRKTFKKWATEKNHQVNDDDDVVQGKKEVEQQQRTALRIKEKLKTRKVSTTTTKTRLHEPLFMPLMNANKLKWLKKETKTYAPQKYSRKTLYGHKMNEARGRQHGHSGSNDNNNRVHRVSESTKQFKSRKTQASKSNRIKYLNKHSASAQAFLEHTKALLWLTHTHSTIHCATYT